MENEYWSILYKLVYHICHARLERFGVVCILRTTVMYTDVVCDVDALPLGRRNRGWRTSTTLWSTPSTAGASSSGSSSALRWTSATCATTCVDPSARLWRLRHKPHASMGSPHRRPCVEFSRSARREASSTVGIRGWSVNSFANSKNDWVCEIEGHIRDRVSGTN